MKKIYQTIKLRHMKSYFQKEYGLDIFKGSEYQEFYILYKNGTYEAVWGKSDLISKIEKDHIKPISYIFDATDRIILEKDVLVKLEEIDNEI